ncbi:hypothetical protein OPT61_g7957 [Boeremia exigua]|uniref:Uncharacterized protein n=1 Tax=Boeremia exigua TaxID=749465 RepID=A0ACC2I190_9PLEO|nr:hypothetical protein OPT61_g7957 [Boeremia exigua]
MADPRVRSSVRKRASVRLDRKTVAFNVGPDKELFTVHEDLICVSPYFRNILQPRRKDVEGNCSICQESLNPEVKELTYCSSSCGGNFHRSCIDELRDSTPDGDVPNCPLCRQPWTAPDFWSGVHELPTLNADAFEAYTEWLYNSNPFPELSAWPIYHACVFGEQIGHQAFSCDARGAMMEIHGYERTFPTAMAVNFMYGRTPVGSSLRGCIVRLFTQLPQEALQRFLAVWREYLSDFTTDLFEALFAERSNVRLFYGPAGRRHLRPNCCPG